MGKPLWRSSGTETLSVSPTLLRIVPGLLWDQIEVAVPRVEFAIATAEPLDVGAASTATLAGDAWVDAREIRLAGSLQALPISWTTHNSWEVEVPVSAGQSTVTLEALRLWRTTVG